MTFFCNHCSSPLSPGSHVNHLMCVKCKRVFTVKIELFEISDDGLLREPGVSTGDETFSVGGERS